MSFLETIACNSPTELTDWLGARLGELLSAHAEHMNNTLPLMEEIPLHPFLATGLADLILKDVNTSVDFQLKDDVGMLAFPLKGTTQVIELDELLQLARA